MVLQQYSSDRKHKNANKNLYFLNNFFFPQSATKYLGQGIEGELLDDGTWSEHLHTRRFNRLKWFNPWHKHIRGRHHGVVDDQQKLVPFVAIDIDRHNGEPMDQHRARCVEVYTKLPKQLRWMWEKNEENGSFKFFGFKYKPIPIDEAIEIAEEIKSKLSFACEIYPLNCHAVWLPLKSEKTTLIDTGKLKREIKKRKVDGKMEAVEVYSLDAYANWIRFGGNVRLEAILAELDRVEANERAEERTILSCNICSFPKNNKPAKKRGKAKGLKDGNPLDRQFPALLSLARHLKRLPTVEQALEHLRITGNYSGDWEDNLTRRTKRCQQMIRRIGKTFDPEKCGGNSYTIPLGKWWSWAKKYARYFVQREVNDLGEVKCRIAITIPELSAAMGMIEFAGVTDPNEDGTIPTDRIRRIWKQLYAAGKIERQWNNGRWKVIRDTLEKLGVIKVNHIFYRKKAMIWNLGEIFTKAKENVKKAVSIITNSILHFLSSIHNSLCSEENVEEEIIEEMEVVEVVRPPPRLNEDPMFNEILMREARRQEEYV